MAIPESEKEYIFSKLKCDKTCKWGKAEDTKGSFCKKHCLRYGEILHEYLSVAKKIEEKSW